MQNRNCQQKWSADLLNDITIKAKAMTKTITGDEAITLSSTNKNAITLKIELIDVLIKNDNNEYVYPTKSCRKPLKDARSYSACWFIR